MRRLHVLVLLVLTAAPLPHAAYSDPARAAPTLKYPRGSLAIIVNPSNPVENLSFSELRRIFLGDRSRWPSGHRVIVTMVDPGHPERDAMLRDVYHMTESAYADHFLKGTYTGDIPAFPKTLSSPEILRKFVFNAPGAIGYLRASDVDESVKVISIDGRFPDSSEYKLQIERTAK
jgi:ABC-type phosphate transport system substrate-binding protein